MKLNAYTIYDVASGVYMRPFFSQADGQAIRGFKDIATDADHEVGKHPEDYTLYRFGLFDDTEGKLAGTQLKKLATGLEMYHQDRHTNLQQKVNGINDNYAKNGEPPMATQEIVELLADAITPGT